MDGDVVVVRAQPDAADGDIVAAILPGPAEEEATVKRLRRKGGRVVLVPENPAIAPIEVEDARIAGKVVAVLRKL
jgi:repressor LexA